MTIAPVVVPLYIGGEDVQSETTFDVFNPLTKEKLHACSSASLDDARAAVQAAHTAFGTWREASPTQRRTIFMKAADILISKAKTAHELMSEEIAAAALWRNANIFGAANFIREAGAVVTSIKGEVLPTDRPGTITHVYREPAGVVYSMVPWNAPLNLALRAICLPIACGNTVILRPSEYTPASQRLVVEAFAEAGLPAGVLNYLPTSAEDAAAITEYCVRAKEVRRVNFTGSTRVGKIIAKLAAKELKQCIFELGGKANVIVMKDANIDDAVKAVVFGGLMNSGQLCMSSERILLHQDIAEEFTSKLLERVKKVKLGNHLLDPSVDLSGLYSEASAQRVIGLVESALSSGAKLLLGDRTITHHTIVQPHVLSNVTPEMEIWQAETFGPVMTLTTFKTEEEALGYANDTDTSLCASIFTADVVRGIQLGRRMRTGSTHINGPTIYIEPSLPNGGVGGASGYGRFGGTTGIHEFTDERILTLNLPGAGYPLAN